MKYIGFGNHIRELRKKKKISQMTVAEWLSISNTTVSRIENGEKLPTYSQYTTLMQKLGEYSDDYLVFLLENDELFGYQKMTELRNALRNGKIKLARSIVNEIDGIEPFNNGLYLQFVMYAKVMTADDMSVDDKIKILIDALKITIHDFRLEKISQYRLSYNEITIISEIATFNNKISKRLEAIRIFQAIKQSMDEHYIDAREKANTYPTLLYNLANLLGREGYHDEVIELCRTAKRIAIKHNHQNIVPYLIAMSATAMKENGDLFGGQHALNEAYFMARAIENYHLADMIKKDAEMNFGITLKYITA